jgi:AraC-like DNA-binding protein
MTVNNEETMQAIRDQDSTGALNVLEEFDAVECQSSETSWLHVAWRSAESWQLPLHHCAKEKVSFRWSGKERAEPQMVDEAALVARANEYIEGHHAENLSLELVADALGADSRHLSRLIKQASEMDFSDYLDSVRVERAKNLLLNPNYYFIEIVSELGFESLGEFNRAFTEVVGELPHTYRARLPDCSVSTLSLVPATR